VDTWEIILYDWITMDWGYNDLAVGQAFSSPVAFDYDMLIPSPERRKRAERLGGSAPIYRVTGEITELWLERGWVLDCGVRASTYGPVPEGLSRGDYVTCEIALEVDHPGRDVMGSIDWEVRGISRCTAPRRSSRIAPDWEQHTCHPVAETDGWRDGQLRDLNVWYVLHCQRSRRDTDADVSHGA
jgi:hypothetical protein